MARTDPSAPPQAAGPPQRGPVRPAAAVPLRAGGRDERAPVGQVLQRPADARHREPAAELRHHDGPAEAAAVQEGGTGGAVDHIGPRVHRMEQVLSPRV